jgi:hypothetical protein
MEARSAFERADVDASGSLSHEEVIGLLTKRGLNCTDGYLDGVFETYDADQSGTIDYGEFELLSKMVARRLANGGGTRLQLCCFRMANLSTHSCYSLTRNATCCG